MWKYFAESAFVSNDTFIRTVNNVSMKSAIWIIVLAMSCTTSKAVMAQHSNDPYLILMQRAGAHAKAHGDKYVPVLSPVDSSVLGEGAKVHVDKLHAAGF